MTNKSIVKNENILTKDLKNYLEESLLEDEIEDVIDIVYESLLYDLHLGDYMERKSVTVKDKRTLSSFPILLQQVEKFIHNLGRSDFDIQDVLFLDNKNSTPRLFEWWESFFPESINKLKISDYSDGWSTTVWYEMKDEQEEKIDKKKEYDRQNYLKKKQLNGTKLKKERDKQKDTKKEYDRLNYLKKKN